MKRTPMPRRVFSEWKVMRIAPEHRATIETAAIRYEGARFSRAMDAYTKSPPRYREKIAVIFGPGRAYEYGGSNAPAFDPSVRIDLD
jgi:hypothetical protein